MFRGVVFFFQAEDGIRDRNVTGVQTCALPISSRSITLIPVSNIAVDGDVRDGDQGNRPARALREGRQGRPVQIGRASVGKECRWRWARSPEKKKERERHHSRRTTRRSADARMV